MNICEVAIKENDEEVDKCKKKTRKTSELWNYFTAISREHALCDLCHHQFSYKTSTSNLRKHIICMHKDKKLQSTDDSRYKSKDDGPTTLQVISDEERINIDERPSHLSERISIKKENYKKNELTPKNNSFSSFMNLKNAWDKTKEFDEFDAYGVTVAAKLRKMDERQRLFCERIINDALFKGALDQLTPLSDIVICITGNT